MELLEQCQIWNENGEYQNPQAGALEFRSLAYGIHGNLHTLPVVFLVEGITQESPYRSGQHIFKLFHNE